ncbi:IS110 family transposase [Thiolapillus brandeum]|uniref:IS110 family transposase n=1 Tax=Thiolapillus brandeum TaxID=1076588 RepID=UPI00155ABCE6
MSLNERIAVGIDVCKSNLDVFHNGIQQYRQFQHTPAGIAELIQWLNESGTIDLVVVEASGGYEVSLWQALCAADIPTARINPKRARDFARALGLLAKTDRM